MNTKALRQKILDLAIHGKLVPQDPNDEPASVLLDRIRAEKERLIQEGKIKRAKKSATSDKSPNGNDEPWELPQGWVWTTVGEMSESILYGVSESAKSDGQQKLLRITDIQDNRVNWPSVPFTTLEGKKAQLYLLCDGDILFARTGATVGKSYLVENAPLNAVYASYLIRIRTHKQISSQYLKCFFESGYYWEQIGLNQVGIGQPNVNGTTLGTLCVPVPPLIEQYRIVAEVARLNSLVDIIEQNQGDLRATISQAKAKILDLAIHGKLVPQDPSDEPAEALIKRINPKWKPSDNPHYPFEIPQGWVWSTYGELYDINKKVNSTDNVDAAFMPMTLLKDGYNNAFDFEKKPWGSIKNGFTHFCEGDIVVAKISPCLENRKSAIISGIPNGIGAGTTEIFSLRNKDSNYPFYNLYTLYVLKSDFFINQCTGTFVGVVGQQRISRTFFSSLPLPVPPVEEQQRIVNTIQNLFAALDAIQSQLKA